MNIKYKGGRPIPTNVLEAIRFSGKSGFLSRKLWYEFFANGNFRWQKRQLQFLVQRGYFKPHCNPIVDRVFVPTDKTERLLHAMKAPRVPPIPVAKIAQVGFVARSMLTLMKEEIIANYELSRELGTYNKRQFLVSDKDGIEKYPDAIFKMKAFGQEQVVAIEYEPRKIAHSRYRDLLSQYSAMTHFSMVLFICESNGIKKSLESALRHIGVTPLYDRIAFTSLYAWKNSPGDAEIKLRNASITLRGIFQKDEKKSREFTGPRASPRGASKPL